VLGEGYPPESADRPVIKPATLDCYSSPKSGYVASYTWPLALIAGATWFGWRRHRRR
jgi:hypothetical protein